ncbi:MAG: 5-(carboxyamino)imidazole ribonucleotide mutase [Candidatus Pacebacteria bacterium]|nr:5-(carboxyamino)imidazole ribonucleotide mutase [Candidatus Paceibacterota bacterium]
MKKTKTQVSIIMGSDSDLPVMQESAKVLEDCGVVYEILVVSAHRTPEMLYKYSKEARNNGLQVIIAGAGGSAHLPGMVASMTTLPVIGIPIKTKTMDGLDSLLSIAQMPPGIPVASVAVNGAKNAGLLATEILALNDKLLAKKLEEYRGKMNKEVKLKSKNLYTKGYKKYLEEK